MRNICLIAASIFLLAVIPLSAQPPGEVTSKAGYPGLPQVTFVTSAAAFQASLYPDYYRTNSVRSDLRWVEQNDSLLMAFWDSSGSAVLQELTRYSGIAWVEDEIDIYLLRYYPTNGEGDPMIIPMTGIKRGVRVEAMPTDTSMFFNVILQLSKRMLSQADQPGHHVRLGIADHPLMRPGAYRRDNLAWLLALVVSQQIFGVDVTFDIYQSGFWTNHHRGRQIFEQFLLQDWILTPSRTLSTWIAQEPWGSELVVATRPPRRTTSDNAEIRSLVEGLPPKGELGFTVRYDDRGRLVIDKIDPQRLAYANGLREGDVIRSVENARVTDQRELIEKLLDGLNAGGATVNLIRNDQPMALVVQPMELAPTLDDSFMWEDDSLQPPDTTASPEQPGQ